MKPPLRQWARAEGTHAPFRNIALAAAEAETMAVLAWLRSYFFSALALAQSEGDSIWAQAPVRL
jgi:hypothetical protein